MPDNLHLPTNIFVFMYYNVGMAGVLLLLLILLGAILRLRNSSPFLLYPDSYQNLIVAHSLQQYHSVVGFLGRSGMVYPDFFMWTRPGYPFLILLANMVTNNTQAAAQGVAFAAGVLAIPAAYFFIRGYGRIVSGDNSEIGKYAGLARALLMALSYNATVWSGFIMTETVGNLLMLLFLWSFFSGISSRFSVFRSQVLGFQSLSYLSGLLFGFAVLCRYEYGILLLPIVGFVFLSHQKPLFFLRNFFISFISVLLLAALFYPMPGTFFVIMRQLVGFIRLLGILILLLVLCGIVLGIIPKNFRKRFWQGVPVILLLLLFGTGFFLVAQIFFGSSAFPLWGELASVRNFVKHDFLISILAWVGFTFMVTFHSYTKPHSDPLLKGYFGNPWQ